MARSRKKSLSQNVVGVATTGLPAPIRKTLGGRFASLLIVVSATALIATGTVKISWEDGRPHVSIDHEKAAAVKAEATEKIQDLQDEYGEERPGLAQHLKKIGKQDNAHAGFFSTQQEDIGLGAQLGDRVEELKNEFSQDHQSTWNILPAPAPEERTAERKKGPLSRLRDRVESRR